MTRSYPKGMFEAKSATFFGYCWGDSDEDELLACSKSWIYMAGAMGDMTKRTEQPISTYGEKNSGEDIDAMLTYWDNTAKHDIDIDICAASVAIALTTAGKSVAKYKDLITDVLRRVDDQIGSQYAWFDPRGWREGTTLAISSSSTVRLLNNWDT